MCAEMKPYETNASNRVIKRGTGLLLSAKGMGPSIQYPFTLATICNERTTMVYNSPVRNS